jgi:hypothetical protein
MISILSLCPTAHDATSLYRGMGPLGRLKQATGKIELMNPEPVDWPVMNQVDVCFLQRPFNQDHLNIAKLAKNWGTPLWLDYDDDLFALTADNPARRAYSSKETHDRMKEMLSLADVVTASTHALARKLGQFAKRVVVIPNAYDDHRIKSSTHKPNQLALWRGSETHQRDLIQYSEAIYNAHLKSAHKWYFIGYNPFFLTEQMDQKRLMIGEPVPVEDYFGVIQEAVRPEIMVVPIADTEFNKSKSSIAWLEGSLAGAACLVPDWEEWQRPGAITYSDPEDFETKLTEMLSGRIDTRALVAQSQAFIEANLKLSEVNKSRLALLTELAGHD